MIPNGRYIIQETMYPANESKFSASPVTRLEHMVVKELEQTQEQNALNRTRYSIAALNSPYSSFS
jgi:hypothetical protein